MPLRRNNLERKSRSAVMKSAYIRNRTSTQIYDGVDASRRHRCAKVKVLSTT